MGNTYKFTTPTKAKTLPQLLARIIHQFSLIKHIWNRDSLHNKFLAIDHLIRENLPLSTWLSLSCYLLSGLEKHSMEEKKKKENGRRRTLSVSSTKVPFLHMQGYHSILSPLICTYSLSLDRTTNIILSLYIEVIKWSA